MSEKMLSGKDLSMTEENEIVSTPILEFYRDKIVLLTGGTGFIGKLLVQKLLRLDVKQVIFLSRPKKGKSVDERMKEIFSGVIFNKLKSKDPNFQSRVRIFDADLQHPNLGLSHENQEYIIENVEIVIHAGADVRFDQTLKKAIEVNVRGTRDLLQMMKRASKLLVFVYVSTIYSNCPIKQIDEKFYDPPVDPEKAINFVESLSQQYEEELNKITKKLISPWPNTYAYTKSLTEDIVRQYSKFLPIAVVRPSIVISTVDDPVEGWTDNIYGLNGVIAGVAFGIVRIMVIDDDVIGDIVPADHVMNCILTVAWNTHRERIPEKNLQNNNHVPDKSVASIYNVCSSPDNPIDYRHIYHYSICAGKLIPPMKSLWIVSWKTTTNFLIYNILKFLYHIIPAFLVDTYLRIIGKTPRMMALYNKVHKFGEVITYFANSQWTFKNSNTKNLLNRMTKEDKELFPFDITKIVWMDFFHVYLRGLRRYVAQETEDNLKDAIKQYNRRQMLHNLMKFSWYSILGYAVFLILKFIFNVESIGSII